MKANERDQALYAVRKATKAGILPCLDGAIPCVDCGKPARECDHRNYKEKLAVEPVCHSCNLKRGSPTGASPPYSTDAPKHQARSRKFAGRSDWTRMLFGSMGMGNENAPTS